MGIVDISLKEKWHWSRAGVVASGGRLPWLLPSRALMSPFRRGNYPTSKPSPKKSKRWAEKPSGGFTHCQTGGY